VFSVLAVTVAVAMGVLEVVAQEASLICSG
jgi:hypothetical protein